MNTLSAHHPDSPNMVASILMSALTAFATFGAIQAAASPDSYAVIGAMLGTIIIFLEARDSGRSWLKTGTSVVGSAFCGAVLPGALLYWLFPEFAQAAHWQIWAGAGFLCGLVGWATVAAGVSIWETRRDALLSKFADKYLPSQDHEKQ